MFNEDNVLKAFKYPSRLSEADTEELIVRMYKSASKSNSKISRMHRVGELVKCKPKRSQIKHHVKKKESEWMQRDLTNSDKDRLKLAWPA